MWHRVQCIKLCGVLFNAQRAKEIQFRTLVFKFSPQKAGKQNILNGGGRGKGSQATGVTSGILSRENVDVVKN